jgi:hypothetical protein
MDEPALGIPVIPFEIPGNHFEQYCFGQRNILKLQRHEDFPGLQFRSNRTDYGHQFALSELGIEI